MLVAATLCGLVAGYQHFGEVLFSDSLHTLHPHLYTNLTVGLWMYVYIVHVNDINCSAW